ncbi:MAG: NADH-quinone oxidoreductase subunit C [Candidatus Bathyarchaeia archaeon]
MTKTDEIIEKLKKEFTDSIIQITPTEANYVAASIKQDIFLKFCKFLRDNLNFEHVSSVSAVDYKDHFTIVYHFYSYARILTLELNVDVTRDDAKIPSVSAIWGGANWHEREQYDFFGIIFEGHPNLQRIMTPPGWEYFPLRKEYKVTGELQA